MERDSIKAVISYQNTDSLKDGESDPVGDGEPGERIDLFRRQVTLVGPTIKQGIIITASREGEAIAIRLPSAFLPEGSEWWKKKLQGVDAATAKAGDDDQALASMLTEGEREGLKQFVGMLYDADGSPRPSGYLALLRLRERLLEQEDYLIENLEHSASVIVEYRNGDHPTVEVPQAGWEYFAGLTKDTVKNYYAIKDRIHILTTVLYAFETKGTAPTVWDVIQRKRERSGGFERTPFDVKLDAIQKVVTDPDLLRELRYNTELYRKADEEENIGYEEPADAFRKDINKNFPDRFGRPVPEDPEEWRRFFEGGKPRPDPSAPESGAESL